MARFCTHCGNALGSGARYCTKCGESVRTSVAPTKTAPREKSEDAVPSEGRDALSSSTSREAKTEQAEETPRISTQISSPRHKDRRVRSWWSVGIALLVIAGIVVGAIYYGGLFGNSSHSSFSRLADRWLARAHDHLMADACRGNLDYSRQSIIPTTTDQRDFLDLLVSQGLYRPAAPVLTAVGLQPQYTRRAAAEEFIRHGQFCVVRGIRIVGVRTGRVRHLIGSSAKGAGTPKSWMPMHISLRWVGLASWAAQGAIAQAFPHLKSDLSQSVMLVQTPSGWALANSAQRVAIESALSVPRPQLQLTAAPGAAASPSRRPGEAPQPRSFAGVPARAQARAPTRAEVRPIVQTAAPSMARSNRRSTHLSASAIFPNSSIECEQAPYPGLVNNTHGYVRFSSGTGDFANINALNTVVTVPPGSRLSGAVLMTVVNQAPPSAVAPMIGTPSWGNPETTFWTVTPSVGTGRSLVRSSVHLRAPLRAGTYYIVFAYQLELGADHVASATNWATNTDNWNDGYNIAEFSLRQIAEAQTAGCAIDKCTFRSGRRILLVPADAITVRVM